jgi:hypothetical protein
VGTLRAAQDELAAVARELRSAARVVLFPASTIGVDDAAIGVPVVTGLVSDVARGQARRAAECSEELDLLATFPVQFTRTVDERETALARAAG